MGYTGSRVTLKTRKQRYKVRRLLRSSETENREEAGQLMDNAELAPNQTLQTPIKVTLDYNCLIDLKEERPNAKAIRQIVDLHRQKHVQLLIPGISASERKKDHNGPAHFFDEFTDLLDHHKIPRECIVYPIARGDLTYSDASYLAPEDPAYKILEWEIHQILHPQIQYNYQVHCQISGYTGQTVDLKWLNRICDTQTMWCHLTCKSDVFVSTDENFHKQTKKPKLISLGAGNICKPDEALELISKEPFPNPSCKLELVKTEGNKTVYIPSSYENYTKWNEAVKNTRSCPV